MGHGNFQQVHCISDIFKHNLEFENGKQTAHDGLKMGSLLAE